MLSTQLTIVRVLGLLLVYLCVMPESTFAQSIPGRDMSIYQKDVFSIENNQTHYKTIVYLNGPDINNITRDTLFNEEKDVAPKRRNSRFILPNIIGGYAAFLDKFKYMDGAISEGEPLRVYFEFTVNEIGVVESVEFDADTDLTTQTLVIKALSKVRFSPAIKDGRFIKVKLSHQLVLYK